MLGNLPLSVRFERSIVESIEIDSFVSGKETTRDWLNDRKERNWNSFPNSLRDFYVTIHVWKLWNSIDRIDT